MVFWVVKLSEDFLVEQIPQILRRGKKMMLSNPEFAHSHKIKAFSRLECFPEMLLVAQVDAPDFAVADALRHFCYRYPTFVIALYCKPLLWSATSRKNVLVPLQSEFDSFEIAVQQIREIVALQIKGRWESSVEWNKEFYDTFFDSQFITSRKNRSLQARLMPQFFVQKDSPEFRSMRAARHTKPNTTLKMFE